MSRRWREVRSEIVVICFDDQSSVRQNINEKWMKNQLSQANEWRLISSMIFAAGGDGWFFAAIIGDLTEDLSVSTNIKKIQSQRSEMREFLHFATSMPLKIVC